MELEAVGIVAAIVGGIVGVITLLYTANEYRRQGAQKRAEYFLEMRKRLKENSSFKHISDLIEDDDPELEKVPFKEKRDFLGFFEEIAMMVNSGLIRKEVAHYMFGYYAIRCWQSHHFWKDVNRDSIYWTMFRDFVEQMETVESAFVFDRKKFRF